MARKVNIPKEKMTQNYIDELMSKEELTPYEVIVLKCYDCCAYAKGQSKEHFAVSKNSVIWCTSNCILNKYLNGAAFGKKAMKLPRQKRNWTEEQRQAAADRMKKRLENINKTQEN